MLLLIIAPGSAAVVSSGLTLVADPRDSNITLASDAEGSLSLSTNTAGSLTLTPDPAS